MPNLGRCADALGCSDLSLAQNGHVQNVHVQNGHVQNGHVQNGHADLLRLGWMAVHMRDEIIVDLSRFGAAPLIT